MARKRPNGAGMNPRKRPDGRWEARVFVFTTDRTWKRVSVYGKSPEHVDSKITELKAQRDKGIPVPASSAKVGDFLVQWLEEHVKTNRRGATYESHESNVRLHINPFIGEKKLARLSIADVQGWIRRLQREGRGDSTVRSARRTLRAALNHVIRTELLTRNVAVYVEMPPVPEENEGRTSLTPAQAKRLLYRAGSQRLFAAYVLGLLGLRRGEVLGLRREDVDLTASTLAVKQTVQRRNGVLLVGPPKSRRSRRTIPLPTFAVAALRTQKLFQDVDREIAGDKWREGGRVFTTPKGVIIDTRNFQRQWVAFRDSTDGMPEITFHELRHSMVSLLTELRTPPRVIMEIAGHADLDTTMKIYTHVRLETQRLALDQLGDLFGRDDHNEGSETG